MTWAPIEMIIAQIGMILLIVICGVICQSTSPYKPSGWRPPGKSFNPHDNYHHDYDDNYPGRGDSYGAPSAASGPEDTTTTTTTSTTPRSREATTPNQSEEDSQSNPALAIANSFAFNRPVYVYSGLPFQPAFTYFK